MEKVDNNIVFTDEEFSRLNNIIKGISWKYNGWSGLSSEDIEMELWIKTMEVLRYHDNIEYNLVARCCYNKALDMCRKAKKYKLGCFNATDQMDALANAINNSSDDLKHKKLSLSEDCTSRIMIQYVIDLFEKGTVERKYIILLVLFLGLENELDTTDDLSSSLFGDKRRELEIAHLLGYADDTSNGYRRMKNRVREVLLDHGYLGDGQF